MDWKYGSPAGVCAPRRGRNDTGPHRSLNLWCMKVARIFSGLLKSDGRREIESAFIIADFDVPIKSCLSFGHIHIHYPAHRT